MKIIHIGGLGNGGRERRMVQLIRGLWSKGIKQKILVVGSDTNYISDIPETVEIVRLSNSRLKAVKTILRILLNFRPNILHLWLDVPMYLYFFGMLKKLFRYKIVAGFVADGNSPINSRIAKAMQYIFAHSEAVISNSRAGLDAKSAPKEKSHVIYNGFDFNRFQDFNKIELYNELDLDPNEPIVAMIARFSPAKNWNMFLTVAEKILSKHQNIQFLAVGDGPQLNHFKELANAKYLANLRFLGKRNDVENILRITDVSVLFSNNEVHAEGVSNSIMESMAAGVPVVATDGGGTPEIISNGVDGYIINPNDASDAIDKILNLLNDKALKDAFSLKSLEKIKAKFTLNNMAEKYINIYNQLG